MESRGGPGVAGFTMFPEDPSHRMDGGPFRQSLRRRVGTQGTRTLPNPEGAQEVRHYAKADKDKRGEVPGATLPHAMTCGRGPRRVRRHNRVRDYIAQWLTTVVGGGMC